MSTTATKRPPAKSDPAPPPVSDEGIVIDPTAVYTREQLARKFRVKVDTISSWSSGPAKKRQLPRPFFVGRQMYWRGKAIIEFMDRKQREAEQR